MEEWKADGSSHESLKLHISVYLESSRGGYAAKGVFDGEGITVLKGSKASLVSSPSIKPSAKELRNKYINESGIVTEDLYFQSPSGAAVFVTGSSANGWVTWLDEGKNTISRYRSESKQPQHMLDDSSIKSASEENRAIQDFSNVESHKAEDLYYMRSKKADYFAVGKFNGEGILVLKGSKVSLSVWPSLNQGGLEKRKHYTDAQRITNCDLYFSSPSGASAFVAGRATNGWDEWKNANGVTLGHVVRKGKNTDDTAPNDGKQKQLVQDKESIKGPYKPSGAETNTESQSIAQIEKHIILTPPVIDPREQKKESLSVGSRSIDEQLARDQRIEELTRQVNQLQAILLQRTMGEGLKEQKEEGRRYTNETGAGLITDTRYHIAPYRMNTPFIRVKKQRWVLETLSTAIGLFAEGEKEWSGDYQAFFLDKTNQVVSNIADFHIDGNQQMNIRLILLSKMSKEKKCFLAIRDQRDIQDEIVALFPFEINILFDADFDV